LRLQVQKWGNCLALRIPKPFAEDAAVKEGTLVDVSFVTPVRKRTITLKQLLAKVHRCNLHGEVDSGPPVGRDVW
jgi:antitoxin MazE